MKFRKKPVVIEAAKFEPMKNIWPAGVVAYLNSSTGYVVNTLEGRALEVADGDWIITGIKGELYPCKDDIFRETYEPVAEVSTLTSDGKFIRLNSGI